MDWNLEQLVYGSFPFREGGYDLLARSSGCSDAVTAEVVAVCRRFGQPPSGEAARAGMFAIRLPSGAWAVVGVVPQGLDDRGRPGALGFHALIVADRDYRRAGADPFGLAAALRDDWSSATPATLPQARCPVAGGARGPGPGGDRRVGRIVAALARRRRVAVEAGEPIDGLAREVWASLPPRVRRRASVATWAFAGENRFDLVAFPRLAGIALDASYLAPGVLDAPEPVVRSRARPIHDIRAPGSGVVAGVGIVAVVALTLAWVRFGRTQARPVAEAPASAVASRPDLAPEPSPAEAARLRAGLQALASRFAGFDLGPTSDPTAFLAGLADALHYHGRLLTAAERDRIAHDPDPDKARALAWHDQIQRFRDDQPWPGDFAGLPLTGQLHAVARSFHLDPTLRAEAVPAALIAALARPGLVRPTPLAARFPALSEYARFLGKLPRLDDFPESETGR